jgi:hypothetical protein
VWGLCLGMVEVVGGWDASEGGGWGWGGSPLMRMGLGLSILILGRGFSLRDGIGEEGDYSCIFGPCRSRFSQIWIWGSNWAASRTRHNIHIHNHQLFNNLLALHTTRPNSNSNNTGQNTNDTHMVSALASLSTNTLMHVTYDEL